MGAIPTDILKVAATIGVWIIAGLGGLATAVGFLAGLAGLELNRRSDAASKIQEQRVADALATAATADAAAAEAKASAATAHERAAEAKADAAKADERAAEARRAAAESELKALQLRAHISNIQLKLGGREITQERAKILIDKLRGQYERLGVVHDGSLEARMYAGAWLLVFEKAGIQASEAVVPMVTGTMDGSARVFLWSPKGANDGQTDYIALREALWEADLFAGGPLADEMRSPAPMFSFPYVEIPSRAPPASSLLEEDISPRQAGFTLNPPPQ